jgi:DNA topoisomerase I
MHLRISIAAMNDMQSLKKYGLRYSCREEDGYSRRPFGKGFAYYDPDGKRVTDPVLKARFASLGIPPAYTHVWICTDDCGHLQAVAKDARGRAQYLYHKDFTARQEEKKFEHMAEFAVALPKIRKTVAADLQRPELDARKVLATVVTLMESTLIRVGNERYAKMNKSFGATTLRKRHVKPAGGRMKVSFVGKSGIARELVIENPSLLKVFRQLQELPGQQLFQYKDSRGDVRTVYSHDVNAYLQEMAGGQLSAKDFRTWNATVQAADLLSAHEPVETLRERKRRMVATIKEVASLLGNTPTVCRKSYIHPRILETYEEVGVLALPQNVTSPRGLAARERRVLAFLSQ